MPRALGTMLFLLGTWLVIAALCLPVGAAILRLLRAEAFDRPADRAVLALWLGVLVLGSGLLAVSTLVPLSPWTGAGLGVLAAGGALAWAPTRSELRELASFVSRGVAGGSLAVAAGIALFTSQPVEWFDSGLYHVQAIRWLSEFGTVEGLGLIHHRLGLSSSWFALAAPFGSGELREHSAAVMGGFALLLLTLHAIAALSRAFARRARRADWVLICGSTLILLGLAVVLRMHVSPTPDLPVNLMALLVGWAIVTLVRAPQRVSAAAGWPGPEAIPLLLALGAMAIKLQAAPLVVVTAVFFLRAGGSVGRRATWLAALALLLVGPWLAAQFVATGCPAYPLAACAEVPWSVGGERAADAAQIAQSFARWKGPEGDGSWIPGWIGDDFSTSLALLAGACALGVCGGGWVALRAPAGARRRRTASWVAALSAAGALMVAVRADEALMVALAAASLLPAGARARGSGWLLAIGLTGVAVTLYGAPAARFAFGYMALLFARLLVFRGARTWRPLGSGLDLQRVPALAPGTLLLVAALAAALGPLLRPTTGPSETPHELGWLVPPALAEPDVTVQEINDVSYRVPSELCWASELPCVPGEEIDPAVGPRNPERGLGAGFVRGR